MKNEKNSIGTEMIRRMLSNQSFEENGGFNSGLPDKKEVYVYDIDLEKKQVSCLVRTLKNEKVTCSKEKVDLDKLRKFVKKGNFEERELVGIAVKKDGSFKLKPKELKPLASFLKRNISDFKKHYEHMKEVKKQLKEEQEREDIFDYDER